MYNEKYLTAKIKSYNGKINTNFHNKKIPKEGLLFICFPVMLVNSIFRTSKNGHPQVSLEECKFIIEEKTIPEYITDDEEISSDDSDRENSDK